MSSKQTPSKKRDQNESDNELEFEDKDLDLDDLYTNKVDQDKLQ